MSSRRAGKVEAEEVERVDGAAAVDAAVTAASFFTVRCFFAALEEAAEAAMFLRC